MENIPTNFLRYTCTPLLLWSDLLLYYFVIRETGHAQAGEKRNRTGIPALRLMIKAIMRFRRGLKSRHRSHHMPEGKVPAWGVLARAFVKFHRRLMKYRSNKQPGNSSDRAQVSSKGMTLTEPVIG